MSGQVSYLCYSTGCKGTGMSMLTPFGCLRKAVDFFQVKADATYSDCFRKGTKIPCTKAFGPLLKKHDVVIVRENLGMGKTFQADILMREMVKAAVARPSSASCT